MISIGKIIEAPYYFEPRQSVVNRLLPSMTEYGVFARNVFAFPGMITPKARLNSFSKWAGPQQLIQSLVTAGFYFDGPGDLVCCYSCGIYLKNWKETMNPFEVHVYYSGWCTHTPLVMGKRYYLTLRQKINLKISQVFGTSAESDQIFQIPEPATQATNSETYIENACVVCHSDTTSIIFLPCNHICCCGPCASCLTKCPICKAAIAGFSWGFISCTGS